MSGATRPASAGRLFAILAAAGGIALFSVMDGVMKHVGLAIGAYNAMLWRAMIGIVLGGALMLLVRRRWPAPHVLRLHVLRGTVNAFMGLSFFWAVTVLPLNEAIALSFISPLVALYLAAWLLRERIRLRAIVGSLLGLAGVAIIMTGKFQGSYDRMAMLGALSVFTSAVLFAYNVILQRQQAQLCDPLEIAFFQQLVIGVLFMSVAPLFGHVPPPGLVPAIGLSTLLTFTSLMVLAWAYARAEAQALIPVEYTAFLWAALIGALYFGEAVTVATLIGAATIVAGCLIALWHRPALAHIETTVA